MKITQNYVERDIYIPIWLDLLSVFQKRDQHQQINLHSNMVRFIINKTIVGYQTNFSIYIPIWLDLLCLVKDNIWAREEHLHSNMVRFII